jgi:hypothetical protein
VVPALAYGAAVGSVQGGRVGDAGSGSLVNSPKFKIHFCNFIFFLPLLGLKRKCVEYHFCSFFGDLQLLCYALFHLSNGLRVI